MYVHLYLLINLSDTWAMITVKIMVSTLCIGKINIWNSKVFSLKYVRPRLPTCWDFLSVSLNLHRFLAKLKISQVQFSHT